MAMDFLKQQTFLGELIMDPNSSDDDQFTLSRRKEAINRGEIQFALDSKAIKEYATSTVSSGYITMPADWLETYILIIDNSVVSTRKEMALMNWERDYQSGEDGPNYYVWEFSGEKRMMFTDDAGYNGKTYKLFYFKKPTVTLTDDTDESIIPDEYREATPYWAASRLFQQIGKAELSNRMLEQYMFYVNKAIVQTHKEYVKFLPATPDISTAFKSRTTDRQGHGNLG